MNRTGDEATALPIEGAVRSGYGVPVIAPGSVRTVMCNGVPVDRVVAPSCKGGWVCCYLNAFRGIGPAMRLPEILLGGRVAVCCWQPFRPRMPATPPPSPPVVPTHAPPTTPGT